MKHNYVSQTLGYEYSVQNATERSLCYSFNNMSTLHVGFYSESVETLIENLCELSGGTEGSDGWISVSKYK